MSAAQPEIVRGAEGGLASGHPRMRHRLSLLVDLASLLPREVDLDALLEEACRRLAAAMESERATLWLVDAERGDLVTRVALLPEVPALRQPLGRGIAGTVAAEGELMRVDDARSDPRFDSSADERTGYTTRTLLAAPVRERVDGPVRGVVQVLNKAGGPFDEDDERYLRALALQIGNVLSLTTLRAGDASQPGVVFRGPFNRIVGRSPAMDAVYERILLAAGTDARVLLRGETGTGKTLLARAIHVNSQRQAGPFVTVDCTTLPSQLVESELFGHERGAFTGADKRVPGRVETADGGTLFLDEVGELPLESQGKLLRFLQDGVFERLGGRETRRADVRILAATNRDLEADVREGRFREDLYYRLRVVELEVPTLRARGADEVERLARHFAEVFAARYDRPPVRFTEDAMSALRDHRWPGNVRELEHWVESAVVLAPDGVIEASHLPAPRTLHSLRPLAGLHLPMDLPLDEVRRRYVEATVDHCEGNRSEAARRLGIGRNTVGRVLDSE